MAVIKPITFFWENIIKKTAVFFWQIITKQLSFLWKRRPSVVLAFFIFLVLLSFGESFSGALIFFRELPHDEPFTPIGLFVPKQEQSYYVEPIVANQLFSAGLPTELKAQLSDLTVPRSESEFGSVVSELLDENKPALSKRWLLTEAFYNLSQNLENFILNDSADNEDIPLKIQLFLEKASQQHEQALSIFCQQVGLGKNWTNGLLQNQCLEQPVDLTYLNLHLENISKDNLPEIQQFLQETRDVKTLKIVSSILIEFAEHSDVEWFEFIFKLLLALAIALIAAIAIGVPLYLMQEETFRTLGKLVFFWLLIIPIGLLFSGVSNYVLMWVISNHAQYVDALQINTQDKLAEWMPDISTVQNKLSQLQTGLKGIYDYETDKNNNFSPEKVNLHLSWLDATYNNYGQTIKEFDVTGRKISPEEAEEKIDRQKNNFDFNHKDGYSELHKKDIEDIQKRFESSVEAEIKTEESRGYGRNAQRQLIYIGTFLYDQTSSLCNKISDELTNLNTFVADLDTHRNKLDDISTTNSTLKPCAIDESWKELWDNPNSDKYSQYKGQNYYASQFLTELKPKYQQLFENTSYNWTIWRNQFGRFHHSVNTLNTQLQLEELENLEKDYDNLIQQIKTAKSAESRFEKQLKLYDQLRKFEVEVSYPQKEIKKSLHQVIRHRLYVLIGSVYYIPSRHNDALNKIFAENLPDQNAVDVLTEIEDEIYFSKEALIFEVENKLDLRLPVDIYPFLTGVIHFSSGKPTFNENLLSNEFSELSDAVNAIFEDESTEINNVFELSNLLVNQLARSLNEKENILVKGAIEERRYDAKQDLFPVLIISVLPDLFTLISGILMIMIKIPPSHQKSFFSRIRRQVFPTQKEKMDEEKEQLQLEWEREVEKWNEEKKTRQFELEKEETKWEDEKKKRQFELEKEETEFQLEIANEFQQIKEDMWKGDELKQEKKASALDALRKSLVLFSCGIVDNDSFQQAELGKKLDDLLQELMNKHRGFREAYKDELRDIGKFAHEFEVLNKQLEVNAEELKLRLTEIENQRFEVNFEQELFELNQLKSKKKNLRDNAKKMLKNFENHLHNVLDASIEMANEEEFNKFFTEKEQEIIKSKYLSLKKYADKIIGLEDEYRL